LHKFVLNLYFLDPKTFYSEKLFDQYEPGLSKIILKNVCYQAHTKNLFLFTPHSSGGESGYPLIDTKFLAEDESRGFMYTGWEFINVQDVNRKFDILKKANHKIISG